MPDRLVLVADGLDVLRLVEAGFGTHHCRVSSAVTAEQALAFARAHRPDLIVLRVDTDGVDGVRLVEQLKRDTNTAGIPVLAILGQSCPDLQLDGESLGFAAVLLKPVSATTLAQVGGLLIERADLFARRSAKLQRSSRPSAREALRSLVPPARVAAAAAVAPRCRSCGNNAAPQLVRTTASSLYYRCGSCDAEWRTTRERPSHVCSQCGHQQRSRTTRD